MAPAVTADGPELRCPNLAAKRGGSGLPLRPGLAAVDCIGLEVAASLLLRAATFGIVAAAYSRLVVMSCQSVSGVSEAYLANGVNFECTDGGRSMT